MRMYFCWNHLPIDQMAVYFWLGFPRCWLGRWWLKFIGVDGVVVGSLFLNGTTNHAEYIIAVYFFSSDTYI